MQAHASQELTALLIYIWYQLTCNILIKIPQENIPTVFLLNRLVKAKLPIRFSYMSDFCLHRQLLHLKRNQQ